MIASYEVAREGAVKGALELPASTGGNVGHWISDIRATRDRHGAALKALVAVLDAPSYGLVVTGFEMQAVDAF